MIPRSTPARGQTAAPLVLLVEDNPDHAELVKRALEGNDPDIELRHVADGALALDYLANRGGFADPLRFPPPRLVLLDLRLPKVDGIEVLRTIKSDPRIQHIPVVMLTTSTSDGDMLRAYRNHVNSYLKKPLDFMEFHRMMESFRRYWFSWNHGPA
jgi:CheY-like chemotaxis protein